MTARAPRKDVAVIGAGVAGLAAAVALSARGAKVTVLERKPFVGGRASSYLHPALKEEVDSQHILLGCCTNLIDLCRLSGADQHLRWYDSIPLLEPATETRPTRRSEIGPGWLPAPSHATMGFLRAEMLAWADKLAVARGLLQFVRGYPVSDEEAFSTWLVRTGQTERAIRHFWEPVVLAALNDGFERSSTRYVGKVMHEMLLRSPKGVRFGVPNVPLNTFFSCFRALSERQGAEFRQRSGVDHLRRSEEGTWELHLASGEVIKAESVVLALPFEQAATLLRTLPASERTVAVLQGLEHFSHAPITTIHLWFDREVTTVATAGLLDTRIQWLFNKTVIRGGDSSAGQYLELTISGSFPEVRMSREQILEPAVKELVTFFPKVREAKLVKAGVLKEARATFSVLPGLDQFRPAADALGDGLYLAGDWTATAWPATMEGAVRSGRLAAEAVLRSAGDGAQVMVPDLEASGLMRWLAR